ncbi:MAG TPA: histidine kinase dimerization/phospho-acceptor domain-containing protein, partial [Burkholderiaceae bacterium]|nr:histidine kinase dimerization/phospho-acceptor domain-containing protein [Burkholderiaceae bacterium]
MEVLGSLARRFASTPLEPDDRARIVHEQLRMLWQHAGTAIVLASVFAVLLALDLAGRIGPGPVYGWLAVKLAIGFGRMAQGRMFMRRTPGGRWDDAAWSRATLASLALDGLVWGLAGAWLMGGATPMAALVGGALAGISCVATFGLQVSFAATFAYTIPILLPTGTALLARGDDFGAIGAAGLALLGALQCATARRSQRRLAENVRLTLRTQSLVEAKDEALALALRQSAVKSQFLASISHELRTPLHGILGIARLLHMESAAPAIVRRVELIEASGLHLLAIINDLLDMSRIEAGRFPMRTERFELAAQIEHVVATHAVRADDRGLVLQQAIRIERPHWVSGDPARFRQVLHNLIGNAIKFTQR